MPMLESNWCQFKKQLVSEKQLVSVHFIDSICQKNELTPYFYARSQGQIIG